MVATTISWKSLLSLLLVLLMSQETAPDGVIDPLPKRGGEASKSAHNPEFYSNCLVGTNVLSLECSAAPAWRAIDERHYGTSRQQAPADNRSLMRKLELMVAVRPVTGLEELDRVANARRAFRAGETDV